jgi:hypothetical protein
MFTHGIDIYAPPQAVVYHMWSRLQRPRDILNFYSSQDAIEKATRKKQAQEYVRQLFLSSNNINSNINGLNYNTSAINSLYNLGNTRKISEFENLVRVKFDGDNSVVLADALNGGQEPSSFANYDFDEIVNNGGSSEKKIQTDNNANSRHLDVLRLVHGYLK